MDWRTLLFSFGGRLNRGKYWLASLIYIGVLLLAVAAVAVISGLQVTSNGPSLFVAVPGFIILVGIFWSSIAVAIKRLHDRDKSGWWLLLFWLVPSVLNAIGESSTSGQGIFINLVGVAIGLWGFVEIGCLKGTTGPNDYGPDPLGAS